MTTAIKTKTLTGAKTIWLAVICALTFPAAVLAQNLQLVLPSQTDSNITHYNNYHFIYLNTNVPARTPLFVFLPGTGGAPAGYQDVLKTAANLGFRTIGLMYDNPVTINSLCGDATDANAYAEARLAVINGGTNTFSSNITTTSISIATADSITNRLMKLLLYLAANNPSQNWTQYLSASAGLNWPQIIIAGHSQGAGHAGIIGKTQPVARSLMFADTDWWTPNGQLPGQPADWISGPSVTAAEYLFGFVHIQDPLILYPEEIATWKDYGLTQFGGPLLVEDHSAPYLGSHEFTTDLPPQDGTNYHGATVADSATPLEPDGVTPVYQPVWQFMMIGPPELPQLQIIWQNSNQLAISWGTFTNYTYQLQTTTNLLSNWYNASAPILGDGTTKTTTINPSGSAQFFRCTVQY
jgi:hypothetical protein